MKGLNAAKKVLASGKDSFGREAFVMARGYDMVRDEFPITQIRREKGYYYGKNRDVWYPIYEISVIPR